LVSIVLFTDQINGALAAGLSLHSKRLSRDVTVLYIKFNKSRKTL